MCVFNPSTHGVKDFIKECLVLEYLHKAILKFVLKPGGGLPRIFTPLVVEKIKKINIYGKNK